ncbi:N-acetylglucosamine-6-phosphate deacetylase [soil metagenome]
MRLELPGFVDIQVNGFAGVDFNDPESSPEEIIRAIDAIHATGVTRLLPTLVTGPLERFARCARTLIDLNLPGVAGLHMEGPYISPLDGPRGAHPRAHVAPASMDDFARRQEAADGRIVLVTLAPEVPGALDLIEHLAGGGIRVAIGHSDATPAVVRDAVAAGATLSTHLGNGCAAMLPRHQNVIWEQLATDRMWASVIADGHHLPPSMVKVFARAKPAHRTILVTDAIAAASCPPGPYRLGEIDIDLAPDGRVSLRGTPFLAGSALSMPEAIGNTVRFTGQELNPVVAMASSIPADYLGIATSGTVTAEWREEESTLRVLEVSGG